MELGRKHRLLQHAQGADDLALIVTQVEHGLPNGGVPRAGVVDTMLLHCSLVGVGALVSESSHKLGKEACLIDRVGAVRRREEGAD